MFPGILSGQRNGLNTLTRQGRRIAVVAGRSRPRAAAALLKSVEKPSNLWRRERKPPRYDDREESGAGVWPRNAQYQQQKQRAAATMSFQQGFPFQSNHGTASAKGVGVGRRPSLSAARDQGWMEREGRSDRSGRGGGGGEDWDYVRDLDPVTGESLVQQRFNALVFSALLRYGPPLPTVVLEQYALTPSRPCYLLLTCDLPGRLRRKVARYHKDTASAFHFFDEVRLKPFELLALIQKEDPSFNPKSDAGGVPFSLLIRNCSYLRAFGGYVTYMRYLRPQVENILGEVELEMFMVHRDTNTPSASPRASRSARMADFPGGSRWHEDMEEPPDISGADSTSVQGRSAVGLDWEDRSTADRQGGDGKNGREREHVRGEEEMKREGMDKRNDEHDTDTDTDTEKLNRRSGAYTEEEEASSGEAFDHKEEEEFMSSGSFSSKTKQDSFLLLTIGQYKFREIPSQDGIRCGPQPWLYSARQI